LLKKISRAFALIAVPFLGSLLIKFLYFTNRNKFHAPDSIGDEPIIISCWHNDLLMFQYSYKYFRKKPRVKALISEHFDGDIIASIMRYFSIGSIRGSSTRGGAKALILCLKELKTGNDIGITPDGPKGPRHEIVGDGLIILAQKTKTKVLLVEIKPSSYWEMNSWDKFIIPKPFGTINYYISDLIDISDMEFEEARTLLKEGLLKHEQ